jgi:hypothetical protein
VSGGDQIIDGFHNDNLLNGSGVRESLDWTNAVWPNVVSASVLKDGSILQQGQQSLTADELIQINYIYRSYTHASTINFYVDIDRNPYNDNNVMKIATAELACTGSAFSEASADWIVTGLSEGTQYYLYVAIENATGKRYLYLDYEFELLAVGSADVTAHPQDQLNVCIGSTVDFTVSGNNIESYQWQESSDEGSNWADISNSEIYSGTYTNTLSVTVSANLDGNLYLCVVSNSQNEAVSNSAALKLDSEKPAITCPAEQSIDLESGQSVYTVSGTEFDPTETSDNCELASVLNDFNDAETLDGAEFPEGTTTVIWTALDIAGNTQACSFDVTVNAAVGLKETTENYISIYPNPTDGRFFVENADGYRCTIVNISGKVVFKGMINSDKTEIELRSLSPGIYFSEFANNKKVIYKELIVR